MEEKFKDIGSDEDEDAFAEDDEAMDADGLAKQSQLPSVNDPRLWQVRVKRGCER